MLDYDITLPDGRNVSVAEYGDPAGQPVLHLHGAASTRLEALPLDESARDLCVRIIALDRAGVARSTPTPGFTYLSYAGDVVSVADALGLKDFTVSGYSNGGAFALAVAQLGGDRIRKVVPINATTPIADLAVKAVVSLSTRLSYALMSRFPKTVARLTVRQAAEPFTEDHLLNEISIATKPWGFDHLAATQRVEIISGDTDAGCQYARVWAAKLTNASLDVLPGGHAGFFTEANSRAMVGILARDVS